MLNLIEINSPKIENEVFVSDAITDLIKRASSTHNLVTTAIVQVNDLSVKQDLWHKASISHFHARDYNAPKPTLWADENYDFDYENDGTITLTFYNDDDSTLIFNATSELTSHIDSGFGYVAFDNLAITNVVIMDADEKTYKVHVTKAAAAEILEDYINCAMSTNKIEYSTDLGEMQENAADAASYNSDPHSYYGVSKSDF